MGNRGAQQNWLKDSGLERPYVLHRRLGCSIPLLLGVVAAAFLVFIEKVFWIPLVWIAIYPLSQLLAKRIFANKIICPLCGFNPTRRKSDGEPRKDYHKVINQLERFKECPNCGLGEIESKKEA